MNLHPSYVMIILRGLLLYFIVTSALYLGLYWLCAHYFNAIIYISGYFSRQYVLINLLT